MGVKMDDICLFWSNTIGHQIPHGLNGYVQVYLARPIMNLETQISPYFVAYAIYCGFKPPWDPQETELVNVRVYLGKAKGSAISLSFPIKLTLVSFSRPLAEPLLGYAAPKVVVTENRPPIYLPGSLLIPKNVFIVVFIWITKFTVSSVSPDSC